MHLLASYTSKGPLELHLHDLETRELIHVLGIQFAVLGSQIGHTSLRKDAQTWARQNGHEIIEWDSSALNPQPKN
jgi:hypothetical protein